MPILSGGGGSGGSRPVSCVLFANGVDVKPAGSHPALWNSLFDNPWDLNPLASIPAGLGLSFVFDGTDGAITATEAGTWAFTLLADTTIPPGNAWRATMRDGMLGLATPPPSWGNGSEVTLTATYTLPAGAVLIPECLTQVAGDGIVPILTDFTLVVVRLA